MATTISAVAACVAVVSLWVSRRAERRSRMPVLVIMPDGQAWRLSNIGNGPALNIVIAQGASSTHPDGLIGASQPTISQFSALRERITLGRSGIYSGESWSNPIHLRPISAGGSQRVPWPYRTTGVGIAYTDALGRFYTVRMSSAGSRVLERHRMPHWLPKEMVKINMVNQWARCDEQPAGSSDREQLDRRLDNPPWGVRPALPGRHARGRGRPAG